MRAPRAIFSLGAAGMGCDLASIAPIHVAGWIEELGQSLSAPTVKQRLAMVRHLFNWLVTGQV